MEPIAWTALEAPMVTVLADICSALGLDEQERAVVLGEDGSQALTEFLERRPAPLPCALLNERQSKAMAYLQTYERISLSEYRQLCPHWSDETLRLDLADLVKRGILEKNGSKKGTSYTLAA
jgi:predicted HTH transcriptional regulator